MSAQTSLPPQPVHQLYQLHHGWLHAWLNRRLGCSFDAADLAQDTFVRLITRPRGLDAERDPRPYLATIARGLVVDHWRRREMERAYLAELATRPPELAPSPERQAMVLQSLLALDALLAQLPSKPRRAFLLAQLHGMPYTDIARELEVSERMVKKYMAQAVLHCLTLDADLAQPAP